MAGHSHWAGIKHKKALVDSKRGRLWSKLSKAIIIAAKMGGGDPETNIRMLINLRKAIPDITWVTTRVEPLPQGFLLTYDLTMNLGEREFKLPSCVIGTVADGLITRIEESREQRRFSVSTPVRPGSLKSTTAVPMGTIISAGMSASGLSFAV